MTHLPTQLFARAVAIVVAVALLAAAAAPLVHLASQVVA